MCAVSFATLFLPALNKRLEASSPGVGLRIMSNRHLSVDVMLVSTSFVERANLTMRMHMRRFTRLTNAFSKKVKNHAHAVALHFTFYNFARVHKMLRVTPAMQAGLAGHVWSMAEPEAKKRGPYKKAD